MQIKVQPTSALYSFLHDIATMNYRMRDGGLYKYTIEGSRWKAQTDEPEEIITISTDDGQLLVIHYNELRLDGRQIEKICTADRCFMASDIRCMVVATISTLLGLGYR